MKKKLRTATLLQHGGYDPKEHGNHLNPPLYLDIAPVQPDIETAAESFAEAEKGFTYSRKGHPNARILEKRLALLENAEDCLVFASGMAATNCLLFEVVKRDDHLVSQRTMYGGTLSFLMKDFIDAGREVTFVDDPLDINEWKRAIRKNTSAFWVEMPSNPKVSLVDLEEITKLARGWGIRVTVDSTFAPLLFKPLKWGATFVLRSGSKYENPGNTSLLGFILGPRQFINPIRNGRYERYGAPASPFDSWLAELGLRTLHLRMPYQSSSALKIAEWLERHPKVSTVHYPALPGSSYYKLSRKYLPHGSGAILSFELRGGKKACDRFMNSIKIFKHVINLGDTRSLATYPCGTTHSKLGEEELEKTGIFESLIRLSIGLEDTDDLTNDLEQALNQQ